MFHFGKAKVQLRLSGKMNRQGIDRQLTFIDHHLDQVEVSKSLQSNSNQGRTYLKSLFNHLKDSSNHQGMVCTNQLK